MCSVCVCVCVCVYTESKEERERERESAIDKLLVFRKLTVGVLILADAGRERNVASLSLALGGALPEIHSSLQENEREGVSLSLSFQYFNLNFAENIDGGKSSSRIKLLMSRCFINGARSSRCV